MDETKKFDWQRVVMVLGVGIIAATFVGGGIWYYMDQNEKAQTKSYSDSVSALQKQINELKSVKKTVTPTPTPSSSIDSSTASYSNSTTNVSFSYPKDYALVDVTSTHIGSGDQFPWYQQQGFDQAELQLTKDGATVFVKIVESTDMDKVLSSLGDTSNSKTVVKYGDYSGYVATAYGSGFDSKIIADTIVGTKYSVAIMAPDHGYSTVLDTIIRSVKFN